MTYVRRYSLFINEIETTAQPNYMVHPVYLWIKFMSRDKCFGSKYQISKLPMKLLNGCIKNKINVRYYYKIVY